MTDTATPAPKAKKSFLKLALVAVVLLAGAGAGAGGYWWWSHQAPAAAAAPEPPPPAGTAIIPVEPFVVNLADPTPRFLRVTLRLVIDKEADARRIEKDPVAMARARSAILELLTTQQAAAMTTPDGKNQLKLAVAERSGAVLNVEVRDVLFTDFVVQF